MRVCCKKRWYREIPLSSFFIQDEGVIILFKPKESTIPEENVKTESDLLAKGGTNANL